MTGMAAFLAAEKLLLPTVAANTKKACIIDKNLLQ